MIELRNQITLSNKIPKQRILLHHNTLLSLICMVALGETLKDSREKTNHCSEKAPPPVLSGGLWIFLVDYKYRLDNFHIFGFFLFSLSFLVNI